MFIDASAIVAVLCEEAKAGEVLAVLQAYDGPVRTSPLAVFEAATGVARARRPAETRPMAAHIHAALAAVESFLETVGIEEIAITGQTARDAVSAAATFGKLIGHPANFNFGDCFSYAAAKICEPPLLFVGNDFVHTDLTSALANPRVGR